MSRVWIILLIGLASCAGPTSAPPGLPPIMAENPAPLPPVDPEVVWNNIVDVVDDYFRIEQEQRIRQDGQALYEGRIDTFPRVGATVFEPWLGDSANEYERLESTLQTIRRRAELRVIPVGEGYLVDVTVYKELEDLRRPAFATTGQATFISGDGVDHNASPILGQAINEGWIPLGRDTSLEQKMLLEIQRRFAYAQPMRLPQTQPRY